jgi:D-serine deaminase-like pyridoxal phosphate-dependent protein
VCCQKVGEAEAMVHGGVPDVLISNEIVGASKLRRLAALARTARIAACVDDPVHVAALAAAAREFDVTLSVLVEVNMGGDRCGVEPGEPALRLAAAPGSSSAGCRPITVRHSICAASPSAVPRSARRSSAPAARAPCSRPTASPARW